MGKARQSKSLTIQQLTAKWSRKEHSNDGCQGKQPRLPARPDAHGPGGAQRPQPGGGGGKQGRRHLQALPQRHSMARPGSHKLAGRGGGPDHALTLHAGRPAGLPVHRGGQGPAQEQRRKVPLRAKPRIVRGAEQTARPRRARADHDLRAHQLVGMLSYRQ